MKRVVIAVVLICLMVAACIVNLIYLTSLIDSLTGTLSEAQMLAEQGDLKQSCSLVDQAKQTYDSSETILSITINEKQLDEVCMNFSRTIQGGRIQDEKQYLVELAGLKESISDLKRSEIVTFGNLF